MDQPTNQPKPSLIPRPSRLSRLPVPSSTLRHVASRENLQQSPRQTISNPRLRSAPSREHLSASTSSKPRLSSTPTRKSQAPVLQTRQRDASAETVIYKPKSQLFRKASEDVLFKKPSKPALREEFVRPDSTEEHDLPQANETHPIEEEEQIDVNVHRKPRPSLSERTMETLHNIPSSPAMRKRGSSFFATESPVRPASSGTQNSRPGSSSDGSMRPPSRSVSSRPSSRAGPASSVPADFRASTNTFRPPQSTLQAPTPLKRPGNAKSLKTPSSTRSNAEPADNTEQRSPSPVKPMGGLPTITSGSKTLSSRPLKPRASVNGLFRKPSMPALDQSNELDRIGYVPKKKSATLSNTSSEAASSTSKSSKATTAITSGDDQESTPRKSSLALRDQIAKAKAAKRAAAAKQAPIAAPSAEEEVPVIPAGTFDFGLSDDPFNQQINQNGAKGLLRKRISAARTDGRLNIAAMGFKEIPEEVMNMYSLESVGTKDGTWAESVDLTRFVAADNELELIADDVFPDVDLREAGDDEDAKGNQFGGLETLDLHGNVLIQLPIGLRRLELLTALNVSNNKLANDCFSVLSQIKSLRDLKIGGNVLAGPLDASITNLQNLEVLDLQRNSITSLPEGFSELLQLRVLNINENRFTSLPFQTLRRLPLIELSAAKNNLTGTLVTADVEELPKLQILDVTSNALSSLDLSGVLSLPSLHQLSCSSNRLTGLPDMASWVSLLTLAAEDNNIESIPDGFVTLPKVKNVNFNGNNLRVLDDRIGGMESLDILRIGGNPLRDKKFSGMTTEDLKRALKARMAPPEPEADKEVDTDGAFYSAPVSPISPRSASSEWPVKPGGVLDRSNTQSHSLNPVVAADVAANHPIKVLELHHNLFKEIPSAVAFFAATLTTLSLAHNELTSDTFLNDDLEMPALKELNLSSNTFNSVQPLIQHLKAPLLERLDISFNRLNSLPPLKRYFPSLITLLASNNTIRELSPESVKGLRVLDCSSNDINSLNARIGLLGGPGGLEMLDVKGNRFRVPKYTILEKGTEATLSWLRDRIPAGEMSPTDVD
ncbi:hypothetical protein F5882DRAFT_327395 [Hyaloscypha sp. PMI_1271]|nr:hypothetical protein F5882DRAFT_327395 [Hyaloscypha sp. PMI_1271]